MHPAYHLSCPSTSNLWRIFFPTKLNPESVVSTLLSMKSESSLMMTCSGRCFPFCVKGTFIFCFNTFFQILICSLIRANFFVFLCLALRPASASNSLRSWCSSSADIISGTLASLSLSVAALCQCILPVLFLYHFLTPLLTSLSFFCLVKFFYFCSSLNSQFNDAFR